jgi:hypothetical protein
MAAEEDDSYDFLFKGQSYYRLSHSHSLIGPQVIVVGDMGVGKTNLQLRFALDTFETDSKTTIGVDFRTKSMVIEASTCFEYGRFLIAHRARS